MTVAERQRPRKVSVPGATFERIDGCDQDVHELQCIRERQRTLSLCADSTAA